MPRSTARTDCPTCGQRIIWALTASRKRQALNYDPDPAGNVAAVHEATGGWRARSSPPGDALSVPEKRYSVHWATSPQCAPKDADGQRAAAEEVVTSLDQWRRARAANEAVKRNRRGKRRPVQTYLGFRRNP